MPSTHWRDFSARQQARVDLPPKFSVRGAGVLRPQVGIHQTWVTLLQSSSPDSCPVWSRRCSKARLPGELVLVSSPMRGRSDWALLGLTVLMLATLNGSQVRAFAFQLVGRSGSDAHSESRPLCVASLSHRPPAPASLCLCRWSRMLGRDHNMGTRLNATHQCAHARLEGS